MADTRCANPEYQLEVDEMTLEYLIYNTLKAHIDEWDPNNRSKSTDEKTTRDTADKKQAPTMLAILDTTVHLFKLNHLERAWTKNTAFYFKLLEFLLLFTHKRGGLSVLSEASCSQAREVGRANVQRRSRCWEAYEQLAGSLSELEGVLLSPRDIEQRARSPIPESIGQEIPLSALLPLFMEISAEVVTLTQNDVSVMWMKLASEFMMQAAIEVHPEAFDPRQAINDTMLASLGWGLPMSTSYFSLVMGVEDREVAEMERMIHDMLQSTEDEESSLTETSWSFHRRNLMENFVSYNNPRAMFKEGADGRREQELLEFEKQVLHYIQNLQAVWAQLNGEPVLLQIEQGRLEGLNDEEFTAFMVRVGSDEHEAKLESIQIPAISKA